MEEDGSSYIHPITSVIAGIVGSLLPSGFISFVMLVYGGIAWTYIIVITASGALGGSLGVLIVDKPRGGVLMAGIFGFTAGVITLLYMINCL